MMKTDFLLKNLKTGQTAIKNTFWLALAEAVSRFLKLILVINVARIFGATEYGKFAFVLSFVSIFIVFSDLGISTIATREMAKSKEEEDNYPSIFSLKMLLSLFSLILMIAFSIFITTDPLIKRVIWILSFYAIITNFNEIIYAFFRARQKMEYEGLAKIIQAILITCTGFFIVFKIPSIENLGLGYLFAGILALISVMFFFHFNVSPLKISLKKSVWKKILFLSWPLGLSAILGIIPIYIGSVIMGYFHLITEVGWYNAAGQIINVLIIPSALISQSFYPIMCKALGESKEKLQKACDYQLLFKISVLIPLVTGTLLFSPKIIDLIYGPDFAPSILVFQILMIGCILSYINSTLSQILVVANMQKKFLVISFCVAVASVSSNLILIPILGLYGVAFSLSGVSLLSFLMLTVFVSKFTSIKLFNPLIKRWITT